jgi:S1-C subfamily serine protease
LLSKGLASRFGQYVSVALLAGGAAGGSALFAGRTRTIEEAHGKIAELSTKTVEQERALRGLEARLEGLQAGLASQGVKDREEHDRLVAEIEKLRAVDAARTTQHLAEVEGRLNLLREALDRSTLEASVRRTDATLNHRELVEPTVRVNAKSEVGSGSVIYSRVRNGKARTFVLTAWHIVKDNVVAEGGPTSIEVDLYDEHLRPRELRGKVVSRHEPLDLALIEVESERPLPVVARLPRPQDLARASVFSKVYAIGCPLGYAPMPTSGELTSTCKELDGVTYWMTNAPTIFGNSGGGIYLAESRQLVGVLSRISAYKNLIDVAVPHMGIVTPMTLVYDWLDTTEFAFVHKEGIEPEPDLLNASHPVAPVPPAPGR